MIAHNCGYRMGAGREVGVFPDIEKTGLWGYAANMGVAMSKAECKAAVKIYRDLSPEIVQAWHDVENAAMACVQSGEPQRAGMLSFDLKSPFLRMRLPSGRYVHYCRPRVEEVEIEYEVEDEETGEITTVKVDGIAAGVADSKKVSMVVEERELMNQAEYNYDMVNLMRRAIEKAMDAIRSKLSYEKAHET